MTRPLERADELLDASEGKSKALGDRPGSGIDEPGPAIASTG